MRKFAFAALMAVSPAFLFAETAQERLQESTKVFNEIMQSRDSAIPEDLLEKAHCAVIVPGLKTAAFGVGGKYGRGFAICRRSGRAGWGAPGAVRVEGGSFGFQIGGSDTDVVMLVMNERGMERLKESKFTLGANASVAAGPVGRTATANTDAYMTAEILSWSRSRGVFAGVALEGATLRNDLDENQELYGKRLTNEQILLSNMAPPAAAKPLVASLNKYSRFEEGTSSADRKVNRKVNKAERTAEKAGDKAERTAEKAGDKIERTADKAADKLEDAADKTADKTRKAGDKVEDKLDR
ncbi:MAG TPA: YSC84-related protein [Bryobacteraceae bacterium]|nr:YSC84-related protein [Bryobacteraceae bacterium]